MDKGKKWGIIVGLIISLPIILILTTSIGVLIQQQYTNVDTINDVVSTNFGDNSVKNVLDHQNGYIIVSVCANDEKSAMDKLKDTYYILSNKKTSKKIDTLSIVVFNETNDVKMLNSTITINEIQETNWANIKTYDDFKQKANIK